ncbi:MAG TPA: hypothetical protein VLT13_14965, partial [Bacteroidota bacterium]|nr:hypothetical protein [Bacteroidota bacterium]
SLVRISPDGDFLWRKTPGFPWDAGKIDTIALDGEGNLYIAGLRTWWSNPSRAALASFDPTGSIRFEVWHTLPDDRAVGSSMIAVEPSGSVCLVAKQAGSPYYEMVRYNAAGLQEWVRQFSGTPEFIARHPSNDFCLVTETAIQRIDTFGIVKWTCSRDGATAFGVRGEWTFAGSSAGGRVTTSAYDSAGTKVWTAMSAPDGSTGDQLVALLPARTGEVTAACTRMRTDGGADYAGHTYNARGVSTAILYYSAPPTSDNRASASCVDKSGNTYVAGVVPARHSSQGEGILLIVKFSPWGDTLFVREVTNPVVKSFQMIGMTADGSGNIRFAGVNATGMVTLLRFSDTGMLEWTTSTSQPLEIAQAGMKTDANGNTIVYGRSYAKEAVALMFGSAGNELWTRRQSGVEYNSIARADFDPAGNVYFGTTTGRDNSAVARLMKMSPDGQLLWERASDLSLFPVQGAGAQELAGVSADSSGRCVVVLKNWRASDSTTSVMTLCYSATGQLLWHARDLEGWKTFFPMLVLRGSNAETIIAGRGFVPWGLSHVLLRYDGNGNRLSRTDIPGEFSLECIALGTHGSVCFAGTPYSLRTGEDQDIHALGYGPTGSLAWLEKFDAADGASDKAVGIGVAADGMVLVTGQSGIPVQDGPPGETGTFFTVIGYTPTIAPGSLVDNPGFESEMRSWVCNTSGSARIDVVSSGEKSLAAAQITIDRPDSGITFYQSGLPLEPQAAYRLTFSARSTTGHDVAVSLIQHGQPNQTYGLSDPVCDLGCEWSSFSIDFMTTGFSTLVSDGRIMFRFPGLAEAGDVYQFDNVVLERLPEPTEPRMVRHPSDMVGGVGQRVMFRVDVPDDDAWIQWQKNGADIPRANLREHGTPPLTASDSGTTYSCRVTWPG